MADYPLRYEFRVWADDLSDLSGRLERLAPPEPESPSRETYLISGATDRCNAKIRSDAMDIKLLVREDRGLELWQPALKAGFPLAAPAIATEIFPTLALEAPRLSRDRYTVEEFLGEVIEPEKRIAVVEVSKRRVRFRLNECWAEFTVVSINDHKQDTVAVESTDPNALMRLVGDLGLKPESNTSYVRRIKRILAA